MGIGVISLSTSQKREITPAPGPPGPPFEADSANNGLSVDAVSGKIVLGNDVGDVLAPAQLLSNREILTDETFFSSFSVILNALQQFIQTELNGASVTVRGSDFSLPAMSLIGGLSSLATFGIRTGAGGSESHFTMQADADFMDVFTQGAGQFNFNFGPNSAVNVSLIRVSVPLLRIQVGSVSVGSNRADFQVSGTASRRLVIEEKIGPTYNVNRGLDSDIFLQNQGAVNFVLPNMVGANNREGFVLRVHVADVAGVTITADLSQVIRFGSLVSSAGGTLSSTDVGACVTCVWNNSEWVTVAFVGAWSIT